MVALSFREELFMRKACIDEKGFLLCSSPLDILELVREQIKYQGNVVCILPLGPQGAGKSTLGSFLKGKIGNMQLISPDALRLELYEKSHLGKRADYSSLKGFMNPQREKKVFRQALQMFRSPLSRIKYIDRMNLTPRSRAPFLQEENINMAILFDIPLDKLLILHNKRKDKRKVIEEAFVKRSFTIMALPLEKEFDLVIRYIPEIHLNEKKG